MKTILTLMTLLISLILPQNHSTASKVYSNESVQSVGGDDHIDPSLISRSPSLTEQESVTAYSDGEENSFSTSFYEFRIYVQTAQIGTNNKGRICVGELQFNPSN